MAPQPNAGPAFNPGDDDIQSWFQTLEPRPEIVPSPQFRTRVLDQIAETSPPWWHAIVPQWRPVLTPALTTGLALSLALNIWWGTQAQLPDPDVGTSREAVRGAPNGSPPQTGPGMSEVAQGDRFVDRHAYNEAIGAYSTYLETEGRTAAVVLEKLSAVYYRTQQYQTAWDAANAALVIHPGSAQAYWHRGQAFEGLGNRPAAIEDWKRAAQQGHVTAQEALQQQGINW